MPEGARITTLPVFVLTHGPGMLTCTAVYIQSSRPLDSWIQTRHQKWTPATGHPSERIEKPRRATCADQLVQSAEGSLPCFEIFAGAPDAATPFVNLAKVEQRRNARDFGRSIFNNECSHATCTCGHEIALARFSSAPSSPISAMNWLGSTLDLTAWRTYEIIKFDVALVTAT